MYGDAAVRPELLVNPKMKIEDLATAKIGLVLAKKFLDGLTSQPDLETLKTQCLAQIAEAGMKNGQVLWPLRIALSGEEFSPGAFELVHILGLDVSRQRVHTMLEKISN